MWNMVQRADFEQRVLFELAGLFETCRCLTSGDAEADRLAEETVVEMYRGWCTLRYECEDRSPAFIVLANQYVRSLPAGARLNFFYPVCARDGSLSDGIPVSGRPVCWPDMATGAIKVEDSLRLAIYSLPPAIRLVTALSLVQGFRRTEISGIVGVPVEIVRTWLRHGRSLLWRQLSAATALQNSGAGLAG